MRKIILIFLLFFFASGTSMVYSQGRFIRKIQEKAEDKAVEKIFKEKNPKQNDESQMDEKPEYEESSPAARQRKSGGLTQTAPDVVQNIADAEAAYKGQRYTESKASVRQALWGVELEIGQKILKSLPESVEGLKAVKEEDRVTSSGIGFVGLIIERVFRGKDEMELRSSVGNDAALLGLAGAYMAGGMYVNTTDETNQKTIRFKEHKAMIQYDDSEGYTLSVPFGQSSVFVITGVNFDSESHFMTAADNFDIETIRKELGEQ